MEAARQLVVDATARHLLERVRKNNSQVFVIRMRACVRARVVTGLSPVQANILVHDQIERGRMRKFWGASEAPVDAIEHVPRRFQNRVNHGGGYLPRAAGK